MNMPAQSVKVKGSVEDVAQLYLTAPKRCSQDSAEGNVSRLRTVAREAFGKTLDQIPVARIPEMWPAFVAARQGRTSPDYSTRRTGNHAINSAIKQAASVFLPSLRPYFQRNGVKLPDDSTVIMWAALAHREPAQADDAALVEAWRSLRETDLDLWLTVGLARFAGLRQSEIIACRGKWIREVGAAVYVDLQDRESDGYWHKTGRRYSAIILDPVLADALLAIPAESPVIDRHNSIRWIQHVPQPWLRQFTGSAKAPLHRLRGLYADHVRRETEEAILARAAAVKEASKNLGHTSVKTTEDHYLSRAD